MRVLVYIVALAAFVAAVPHPQIELTDIPVSISATIATPTLPVIASTSLNIPMTAPSVFPTGVFSFNLSSTSRRKIPPHSEPIPIFQKPCDCPNLSTVAYPCWATDALQKCNFEENHSWVCWYSANYGCPSPTRACSNLFQPTPKTGRHPCELGPPNTGIDAAITDAAVRR